MMGEALEAVRSNVVSYETFSPGRREEETVDDSCALFRYGSVIIMDAKNETNPEFECGLLLVPEGRKHDPLFSSMKGQWQVAESLKARRLIMVILKSRGHQTPVDSIEEMVKKDLCPLVKCFLPLEYRTTLNSTVKFMVESNAAGRTKELESISSLLSGAVVVEDVVITKNCSGKRVEPVFFRRLLFGRNPNLIQSEARLVRDKQAVKSKDRISSEVQKWERQSKKRRELKSTDKENNKEVPELQPSCLMGVADIFEDLMVDHSHLASSYHLGMIAGFVLLGNRLEHSWPSRYQMRSMVVGLGGGVLPMFMHKHLPLADIQVVEVDAKIGDIAKRYFGFSEDHRMKLQIGDGVAVVQEIATAVSPSNIARCTVTTIAPKFDVLMIDTDSEDPSNGVSCPAPAFMDMWFLESAKKILRDDGLLIINVVTSVVQHYRNYIAILKRIFGEVYDIEVLKDVNLVLIATPQQQSGGRDGSENCKDYSRSCSWLEQTIRKSSSWDCGTLLTKLVQNVRRLQLVYIHSAENFIYCSWDRLDHARIAWSSTDLLESRHLPRKILYKSI